MQELGRLDDDATVFKLIGPVLVKQDVEDAKATVGSRLELIERELCVLARASGSLRCDAWMPLPAPAAAHLARPRARYAPHPSSHANLQRSERIGTEIETKEKEQLATRQMIMQVQQAQAAAKAAGGGAGGATPGGGSYASAAGNAEQ